MTGPEERDLQRTQTDGHPKERERAEFVLFITELRVSLTGAQILFAFLLGLPFTSHFERITGSGNREIYFTGFLCCATATLLLIAPSVYHRVHWHEAQETPRSLLVAFNRLAAIGAGFLAVGMACTICLVAGVLFRPLVGAVLGALASGGFAWFWFGLPSLHRSRARKARGVEPHRR